MIRERRGEWSGVVRTGLPAEGSGASRGEGSGREVEARNDHGRSLWPTAKRFCSPPDKTHHWSVNPNILTTRYSVVSQEHRLRRGAAMRTAGCKLKWGP